MPKAKTSTASAAAHTSTTTSAKPRPKPNRKSKIAKSCLTCRARKVVSSTSPGCCRPLIRWAWLEVWLTNQVRVVLTVCDVSVSKCDPPFLFSQAKLIGNHSWTWSWFDRYCRGDDPAAVVCVYQTTGEESGAIKREESTDTASSGADRDEEQARAAQARSHQIYIDQQDGERQAGIEYQEFIALELEALNARPEDVIEEEAIQDSVRQPDILPQLLLQDIIPAPGNNPRKFSRHNWFWPTYSILSFAVPYTFGTCGHELPTLGRTPSAVNPRQYNPYPIIHLPPIVSTQLSADRPQPITPSVIPPTLRPQLLSLPLPALIRPSAPHLNLPFFSSSDFTGEFVSQPYETPLSEFNYPLQTSRPMTGSGSALFERRKSFCFAVEREIVSNEEPPYPSPVSVVSANTTSI